MSSSIIIRGVPEDVVETLKARAAAGGQSLQAYMLEAAKRTAAVGSMQEWVESVARRQATWAVEGTTPNLSVEDILAAIDDRT